jgi:hypothetical protein
MISNTSISDLAIVPPMCLLVFKILPLTNLHYSMTGNACFRFLRPALQPKYRSLSTPKQDAYVQFYTAVRRFSKSVPRPNLSHLNDTPIIKTENRKPEHASSLEPALENVSKSQREDVRSRIKELRAANALEYPRVQKVEFPMTCAEFRKNYADIKPDESREEDNGITLRGKFLDAPRKLISKKVRKAVFFANSGIQTCVYGHYPRWL